MGLQYRRRIRTGKNTFVNVSGGGVSMTKRFGPLSINSRGHVSIRLGSGFSFRIL
jgi:hypothetical protein